MAPWNALRGVRRRGESCASAVIPRLIAIAEDMTPREIRLMLKAIQYNLVSPVFQLRGVPLRCRFAPGPVYSSCEFQERLCALSNSIEEFFHVWLQRTLFEL